MTARGFGGKTLINLVRPISQGSRCERALRMRMRMCLALIWGRPHKERLLPEEGEAGVSLPRKQN
jgi:hypothetical protein